MLFQQQHCLHIKTGGPGFTDISSAVQLWLREINAGEGLLTAFIRHTSASLTIQENADPDVLADLGQILRDIAPENRSYRHSCEGPDDMPAHIKSMLTSTSLSIPVQDCRALLGTWQGLYVIEHRTQSHRREIVLQFIGKTNER